MSAVALVIGVGVGAAIALHSRSGSAAGSSEATTWAAGERPAPGFALRDQHGKPLSLAQYQGRPVLLTFIDPLCRDFCPREASVLSEAVAELGEGAPAIVAVSVNPWQDSSQNFAEDAVHWRLAPGWRWGVGSYAELAKVWRSYLVDVQVAKQTIAGVTIRKITHTGAAYLIDGDGHERALFLYPFTTGQLVDTAKKLTG